MKAQEVPLPKYQDSAPSSDESPASTGVLVGRLWRDYLSRYWGRLLLALGAIAVYAASASAIPIGVEWINAAFSGEPKASGVDANFGARFPDAIGGVMVWGPAIILFLGATNALSQYIQTRLSASAALSVLRDLQNQMFAALSASDDAQIRALGAGQAMTLFTNDTLVMRETLTRVASAVRDALTLAGLCAVMIYYDWVLFLMVIVIYPALGWPIMRIGKYLRTRSSEAQSQAGGIASLLKETVGGARMVKTYQLEAHEKKRAESAFNERLTLLNSMANLRAMNEPFIFFVGAVALAFVVAVVAMRINEGALSGAQFISFIIALLLLSQPARGLSTLNAVAQEGFGALERMLKLIDTVPQIADAENGALLKVSAGAVAFRNVHFAYSPDAPALNNLSLDIPAGKVTALVGESGGGKSTLFNLLPRLYDADAGTIEIDGQSTSAVTLASLRASIALVSQDTVLFNDTIAANIALGRPGADRAAIESAAKLAAADEFIAQLPMGYETSVGENGEHLSGGQRQRIAIARAFLKDAPILLLDEATSALDAQSEAKVQEALARLSEGRTTIVIAHRLATVKGADLIAVIAKGTVVETGTHEGLMAKDGVYARFARLQFTESAQ